VFLISAYAPVGAANQNLWDDSIEKLESCIHRKPAGDIFVIGCDSNSSMGVSQSRSNSDSLRSVGSFGLKHRNRAGIHFSTYQLEVNSLIAATTCFEKNRYKTWTHPRSRLGHQIDHIITLKNDFCRFIDAGSTKSLIDTDHLGVMCLLRVSVHLTKQSKTLRQTLARQTRYPWP